MINQTPLITESHSPLHILDEIGRNNAQRLWSQPDDRIYIEETSGDGHRVTRDVYFSQLEYAICDVRSLGPIYEEGFSIEIGGVIKYTFRGAKVGNVSIRIIRDGIDPLILELDNELTLVGASRDLSQDEVDLSLNYAKSFEDEWCQADNSILQFFNSEDIPS